MRGALRRLGSRRDDPGIIPAYAGSTGMIGMSRALTEDHPRVCGEHGATIMAHKVE